MNNSCSSKRIAVIGGLSDHKFASKVRPLFQSVNVERIYLFRYQGNPVYEVNDKVIEPFKGKKLPRRVYDICCLAYFCSLCLFRKIDLLVGIYFYPHGVFAGLLGRIFCIPVIQIMPGTDLAVYLETQRFSRILASANAIGLRGEISMQQLIKAGHPPDQLFILNNVFEPENLPGKEIEVHRVYDLITIGYLAEGKRIDIFLKLVAILKCRFPQIKCLIVGDGPERRKLERLSAELDLEDNVTFHGFAQRVSEFLVLSRVFVLTSRLEGLPMVIVEAMTYGLPVVAPGINDIPTIVKHGMNGLIVEDSKIESFAGACSDLLTNEPLRHNMGELAANDMKIRCSNEYSYESVFRVWQALLGRIEMETDGGQSKLSSESESALLGSARSSFNSNKPTMAARFARINKVFRQGSQL